MPKTKISEYSQTAADNTDINGIDIALNAHYSSTLSYVSFPPMVVTPNETNVSTVQNINII